MQLDVSNVNKKFPTSLNCSDRLQSPATLKQNCYVYCFQFQRMSFKCALRGFPESYDWSPTATISYRVYVGKPDKGNYHIRNRMGTKREGKYRQMYCNCNLTLFPVIQSADLCNWKLLGIVPGA